MKKEYIIGGLALLGVVGVISYFSKPKRNSEGFFGATGMGKFASTSRGIRGNCAYCITESGVQYHTGENRTCAGRDRCITKYEPRY